MNCSRNSVRKICWMTRWQTIGYFSLCQEIRQFHGKSCHHFSKGLVRHSVRTGQNGLNSRLLVTERSICRSQGLFKEDILGSNFEENLSEAEVVSDDSNKLKTSSSTNEAYERPDAVSSFYETVVRELGISREKALLMFSSYKNKNPEHILRKIECFRQVGITNEMMKKEKKIFSENSVEDCEEYLEYYHQLMSMNIDIRSPFKRNDYKMSSLKMLKNQVDELQNDYGMNTDMIRKWLKKTPPNILLDKMKILTDNGIPKHSDYSKYSFLFNLSPKDLLNVFQYLKDSNAEMVTACELEMILHENNFRIQQVELLSDVTGISVKKIRKLTRDLGPVSITKRGLAQKCEMLENYGLSKQDILETCSVLKLSKNKLKDFLQEYQELQKSGSIPWNLKDFLLNIENGLLSMKKNIETVSNNLIKLKSTLDINIDNLTPFWIPVCLNKNFNSILKKIDIIKTVIPAEQIVTEVGISVLTDKTTKKQFPGAIKALSAKSEPSMSDLVRYFYDTNMFFKFSQTKQICQVLKIKYKKDFFFKEINVDRVSVEANYRLLRRHGLELKTLQKLPIILGHNHDQLKHQIQLLPTRPEIQDKENCQLDSFTGLNFLQYFLERDDKFQSTVKRIGNTDNEETEEDEDFDGELMVQ